MYEFILKFSLFAFLQSCVLATVLALASPTWADNYYACFNLKSRIARQTASPKIILTGGSNTAFGFDSKKIAELTGRPVVNLGFYAGTGVDMILNQTEALSESGDTVFISLEYEHFKHPTSNSVSDVWMIWVGDSSSLSWSGKDAYSSIMSGGLNLIGGQVRLASKCLMGGWPVDPLYNVNRLSGHGDIIIPPDYPAKLNVNMDAPSDSSALRLFDQNHQQVIGRLEDFVKSLSSKGVKVYFVYPPRLDVSYTKEEPLIDLIQKNIPQSLKFINTPRQLVFDEIYFADSTYHLNPEGKKRATSLIAKNIKEVIDTDNKNQ